MSVNGEPEKKPSWYERLKGAVGKSKRVQAVWDRMHSVGAFTPILDMDDTEARRGELRLIMNEIQKDWMETFDPDKAEELTPEMVKMFKQRCNNRVFAMFFSVGSPWYRGLDDRELARKVRAYLELWNYVGDHLSFVDDMYMWSMQLVNLSWKALDVTNVPPIFLETHTVVQPASQRVKLSEEVKEY